LDGFIFGQFDEFLVLVVSLNIDSETTNHKFYIGSQTCAMVLFFFFAKQSFC
tara:strand:+ start:532 stop:687 length:156 start_codon:yes stop_codon:yes gene_type:complete